jgi:phosphohistidine phosphatase
MLQECESGPAKDQAMKTLFLLRHAKSSWKDAGLSDFERPLNKRGVHSANLLGGVLAKREPQPDLILSSPAVRAKETTLLVTEGAAFAGEVRYVDRLYLASAGTLLEIVSQLDDRHEAVMIVGHNPSLETLLPRLCGVREEMPTCALAMISFPVDLWSESSESPGQLEWFIKAKELLDR